MIALKISHKYVLIAIVVGAIFLVPLMSVSGAATKELTESPFVKSEIKNIDYEEVSGTERVKNCTEVSIKIVLANISKEIDSSKLIFYSELVGAEGHIKDTVLQNGSSYMLNHEAVGEEAVVSWSGEAPNVKRRDSFTLLNITQETREGQYSVESITRDVSSEMIEDALNVYYKAKKAIEEANQTITNAREKGLIVASATTKYELAREHLNNSLGHYNSGRQDAALEEAKRALNHAEAANNLTKGAETTSKIRNYGILAAVVVIIVVVLAVILMQRKRKRGIY
uniref:Uncharacterized protein n=1 Tax=Uncultured archaeon GZfos26G2 TaxID=3386331 RepID=Q64C30_UNCAG|nr:hypothetical protein GZ26D6_23 [uncultured archaeon GZfos26D6]